MALATEICLELHCGVRIQEVDEGKTVTRTMEEICGHVNKDELTANTRIARRHEPGVKNQDPGGSTLAEHSGCATQYPGGERKNIAQAVVRVPRTRTPTHRRQGRPPTIAYHHSLGHVTVDVQVKQVSPWGIPAKGPFLGSVPRSHGSTVATLSGLQLATLSSARVHAYAKRQWRDRRTGTSRPLGPQ